MLGEEATLKKGGKIRNKGKGYHYLVQYHLNELSFALERNLG